MFRMWLYAPAPARLLNRRWLSLFLIVAALAVAASGYPREAAASSPLDAVGRLVIDGDGLCTAFVVRSVERSAHSRIGEPGGVYENWLVTAGHCIGSEMVFRQRSASYPVHAVVGYSMGSPRGHDVMVLAFFTPRPMPALEPAFGEYPKPGDKLLLIGYGRNALMMRVGPVVGYDERGRMAIENFVSPGNSGGPVLIPGTRRVVGIGVETTLDVRGGHLWLCAFGACGVKPPYYASHIDRLLGVADFELAAGTP